MPPRNKCCVVRGCKNTSRNSSVRFHSFPKTKGRFEDWLAFCDNDLLRGLTRDNCHKFVCSEHFTRDDYQNELQVKLNRNASPKIRPYPDSSNPAALDSDTISPNSVPEVPSPTEPSFSPLRIKSEYPDPTDTPSFESIYFIQNPPSPQSSTTDSNLITNPSSSSPPPQSCTSHSTWGTTGINDCSFTALKRSLEEMVDGYRLCYLIFGEMSLKESLRYNPKFDRIEGLEDRGHLGRTNLAAKYAFMFMLRGLVQKWKQPIAFYFSNNEMGSSDLSQLIEEVLRACFDAGAIVMATVCDLNANNEAALNALKGDVFLPSDPVFSFRGREIVTIYDPSHLLSCTWNGLLKYDAKCFIKLPGYEFKGVASWKHVETAYREDKATRIHMLLKLGDEHIYPDSRAKSNVRLATQVLSYKVAGCVASYTRTGELPQDGMCTAGLISLLNDLMDSFNGELSHPENGEDYKVRLQGRSPHWVLWERASGTLKAMRFIVPPSSPGQPSEEKKLPFQQGWLMNIKAMKLLWANIMAFNNACEDWVAEIHSLELRYINKDALENVFQLIRTHCGSDDLPTAWQFVDALKNCIIKGLPFKEKWATRLNDKAKLLSDLQTFLCEDQQPSVPETDILTTSKSVESMSDDVTLLDDRVLQSTAYASCYIARRLWDLGLCECCKSVLYSSNTELFQQEVIEHRDNDVEQRHSIYVSENLVVTVARGMTLVEGLLSVDRSISDVSKTLQHTLERELEFTWLSNARCGHVSILLQRFLELLCDVCLTWCCRSYNRRVEVIAKRQQKMIK